MKKTRGTYHRMLETEYVLQNNKLFPHVDVKLFVRKK